MKALFPALVLAMVLVCPLSAAEDRPLDRLVDAYGIAQSRGDTDAIDKALSLAEQYLSAHPGDGRALTYKGSLAAMRARESILPWRKLTFLKDGIDWMDDGVAAVLKDKSLARGRTEIEVRMVRGTTSARIPGAFGRGGVARADFRAVVANPQFEAIAPLHRASAYAWLAILTHRDGDEGGARGWLDKARQADATIADNLWGQFK